MSMSNFWTTYINLLCWCVTFEPLIHIYYVHVQPIKTIYNLFCCCLTNEPLIPIYYWKLLFDNYSIIVHEPITITNLMNLLQYQCLTNQIPNPNQPNTKHNQPVTIHYMTIQHHSFPNTNKEIKITITIMITWFNSLTYTTWL